jgi:hypothetical protein
VAGLQRLLREGNSAASPAKLSASKIAKRWSLSQISSLGV